MQEQDMEGDENMYTKYVELRDKAGVKDFTVSKKTGIPSSTFSDWKKGKSKPKLEKLSKIAKFFGVSVEVFIEK